MIAFCLANFLSTITWITNSRIHIAKTANAPFHHVFKKRYSLYTKVIPSLPMKDAFDIKYPERAARAAKNTTNKEIRFTFIAAK